MADHPTQTDRGDAASEPLLVPAPEVRRLLGGISRRKLAMMVAAGELESVRIGTRRLFTLQGLRAFVAARSEGGR